MEGWKYHKSFKNIKNNRQKCRNIINFSDPSLEFTYNFHLFLQILSKKTLDSTIELNILYDLSLNISFEEYSLILLIISRSIFNRNQSWIIMACVSIYFRLNLLLVSNSTISIFIIYFCLCSTCVTIDTDVILIP